MMELQVNGNVNITVELGAKTLALLLGGASAAPAKEVDFKTPNAKEKAIVEEAKKVVEEKKPEPKKPAAKKGDDFADLDDDAKLEAIKAEVTRNTKKGKSADIKFMLANFEAGRASELAPEDYGAFYDGLLRYKDGETVTEIYPEEEDLG